MLKENLMTVAALGSNQYVNPWTQEDLDYLKENYRSMSKDEIIAKLDRSWNAIKHKSFKIGISRHNLKHVSFPYSHFTDENIQTLKEFYPRSPSQVILRLIPNHDWASILSKASELHISRDAPLRIFQPKMFHLNQSEWAYIAGIVDGEGTIENYHTHDGSTYSPRISISNTNMDLMNWLKTKLEGTVRETQNYKNNPRCKPCYEWQTHRYGNVYSILTALIPYLIIKRAKAESALSRLRGHVSVPEGEL